MNYQCISSGELWTIFWILLWLWSITHSFLVTVTAWKTSILHPLIKGTNLPTAYLSYRPVSNMPFLSKVLEKAALGQFQSHCQNHGLIPTYQSAYCKDHSCEMAIARIMDDLLTTMEDGEVSCMLSMDLSAAFDTVDYGILDSVLEDSFGVSGNALHWFNSYLSPRWCKVAVGNQYSAPKLLQCSIPQGSCLGPTLYTIYASTLADSVPDDMSIYGYADDHAHGFHWEF